MKISAISFPFRSAEVRMKAATPAFISVIFSNARYLILLSLVKTVHPFSPATLSQLISCSSGANDHRGLKQLPRSCEGPQQFVSFREIGQEKR
jgi:hypothetical protein